MKNAFLVCTSDFYYNNRIFDLQSPYNRDNAWYPMFFLKKIFNNKNIILNTYDKLKEELPDRFILIFNDIPDDIDFYIDRYVNVPKYLLIMESVFINKKNSDLTLHEKFTKIFTYSDDLVDNNKYFKINYSFDIPKKINKVISNKEHFAAMVGGNKKCDNELELYSKREEAIHWFEKNHIEEFDLFGIGWEENLISYKYPVISKFLYNAGILKKTTEKYLVSKTPIFPSYCGKIERKKDVLEKYKFCICYENFRDVPGWITEKIFDCFFAGCIPVYWGANNITDYVPANCFIDKRNFDSYEKLYDFMKSMTDDTYMDYLNNIEAFLNSEKIYQFSSEYFANTIVNEILKDLENTLN